MFVFVFRTRLRAFSLSFCFVSFYIYVLSASVLLLLMYCVVGAESIFFEDCSQLYYFQLSFVIGSKY